MQVLLACLKLRDTEAAHTLKPDVGMIDTFKKDSKRIAATHMLKSQRQVLWAHL